MWSAPRPAPHIHSPSAPRLASFSTSTAWPSAALTASAARTPTQPGRIVELPELAGRAVHRAGQPHADADELLAAHARLVERVLEQRARQRDRLGGGQVGVERAVALGQQLVREVGDRHPQMPLAEVDPGDDARPCGAARSGPAGGRPARAPAGWTGSAGSTTSPAACRSLTTADTVEGASAARRARSARDTAPASARTPTTRARASRRDVLSMAAERYTRNYRNAKRLILRCRS